MIDRHAGCAIGPLIPRLSAVSFALATCGSHVIATTGTARAGASMITSAGVAGIDSVALYANDCAGGGK